MGFQLDGADRWQQHGISYCMLIIFGVLFFFLLLLLLFFDRSLFLYVSQFAKGIFFLQRDQNK